MAADIQLPGNLQAIGEAARDDCYIYIHQDVYKKLESYSGSNTGKELGSILVGQHVEQLNRQHIIISDFIEAKYTDASASTLTFTHETWAYVHAELNKNPGDLKILGWHHTHPNYGIFLSSYDIFIQENFFNLPFQIAYVIDPINDKRGFFQWKDGKIQKAEGFFVYEEIGKFIKLPVKKIKKADSEEPTPTTKRPNKRIPILLTALLVLLLGYLFTSQYQMKNQIRDLTNVNSRLSLDLGKLQRSVWGGEATENAINNAAYGQSLADKVNQHDLLIENRADLPESNVQQAIPAPDNYVNFIKYTIQPGDELMRICQKLGLDYKANSPLILKINQIKNADYIQAGEIILVPVK